MTVHRLLLEADSYELTCWQAFLRADSEFREEQQQRAKHDAQFEE